MNPKIEHCLYQAGLTAQGCWEDLDTYTQEGIEKFAQLIVREYIGILEEEIKLVEGFKSTAVKADVIKCHTSKIYHFNKLIDKSKKHFGVEE